MLRNLGQSSLTPLLTTVPSALWARTHLGEVSLGKARETSRGLLLSGSELVWTNC